ncbi:MAG: molybdopterin biosynthesis protein, partial [Candidatus Heimdallarchaeota archaeon]|nr:molybdopterin biosynthesis protein [Candidatus Heimdallarchaeota archaeon]
MSERKIFRNLISADEAIAIFEKNTPRNRLSSEIVDLNDCLGRILAEEIISPVNVPPFDRASMDGFAILAEDLVDAAEDNPVSLEVLGLVMAGHVFNGLVEAGKCVEISTGAPVPAGANAVVMVEYTDKRANSVLVSKSETPGSNIMTAGADIQQGELMFTARTLLTSRELAVLSAMGFSKLQVIRKPTIGIFSSGDEIVAPGTDLVPGKLFDINSTSIAMNVIENGGEPKFLGIIEDQFEVIETKLRDALPDHDLILISGGTSAGMGDMIYTIVDKLGSPGLLVHGIKVKPGKPTILAVCNGTPLIGLPGYPASALSIFKLFAVPYIRQLAGLVPLRDSDHIQATIKQRFRSVLGRHEFKPVNLINSPDGWLAFPVPGGSGAITSIARADGFVEIPEGISFLEANSQVLVKLLSEQIEPVSLQLIGSHCIALAQLLKLLSQKYPQITTRTISVGSTGGVAAIRRGEAHIAGIHLLKGDLGYNTWLEADMKATIIKGYKRMQGIIVVKGNPKKIHNISDLVRPD